MTTEELRSLARRIVEEARRLSAAHTDQGSAPVNYVCVFTKDQAEYDELVGLGTQLGPVVQDTKMGPVFHIHPIPTTAGRLNLLKIRRPDPNRPERGDADFTVRDYRSFKATHLGKPGFSLIERADMEMIELIDPAFDVLAYYSNPPLGVILKVPAPSGTSSLPARGPHKESQPSDPDANAN